MPSTIEKQVVIGLHQYTLPAHSFGCFRCDFGAESCLRAAPGRVFETSAPKFGSAVTPKSDHDGRRLRRDVKLQRAVFISYGSADHEFAQEACKALEESGISCWIAPRDILAGHDWSAAIPSAIDASRLVLLILSASSARSAQIAHEIHIAQNARKIILPLRIDEAQPDGALRYLLAGLQRIDGFSASRRATIENLIVQIRRNLAELEPRSLSAPPRAAALANNLPWARNAFVGRTAECVALQELTILRRLVTIVGPGGVGKTRTAIEVARSLQQNYLDGVWLVELGSYPTKAWFRAALPNR